MSRTYLTEMTTINDQMISDKTPNTFD